MRKFKLTPVLGAGILALALLTTLTPQIEARNHGRYRISRIPVTRYYSGNAYTPYYYSTPGYYGGYRSYISPYSSYYSPNYGYYGNSYYRNSYYWPGYNNGYSYGYRIPGTSFSLPGVSYFLP